MTKQYTFRIFDPAHRAFESTDFIAADDRAALQAATELCDQHSVEIWEQDRLVTRVGRGGVTVINA